MNKPGRLRRAVRWLTAGDPVVGIAMTALVIYYVATPGIFQGKAQGDGWFGFQYLRNIVSFHSLDMMNVVPQYIRVFGLSGPGHHMPNRCPFGPVLVWMPFYLVGIGLEWLASLLHLIGAPTGQSRLVVEVTGLGTVFGVLIGWRSTYALVARHCGPTAARLGSIAAVWATPVAWYAVTQPMYQHGLAFCFAAVVIDRWDATRGDPGWRRMMILGLLGGLGMSMREQEGLWLLLPGLEALWHVVRGPERRRWFLGGVVLTLMTLIAFLPQMLVWRYYTGSLLHPPQVEPLRLGMPFIGIALFSTRSGLFPWSPIVYASVLGLCVPGRSRLTAWALTGVFALNVYVVASAWMVTGAWGYGARRLSDGAPLFALGLGLVWEAAGRVKWHRLARRALLAFTVFCIFLNCVTMELVRSRKIASSGGYARSAERFLKDAGAPPAVSHFFGVVGYPFVQPAGWLFALRWKVPVATFEGLVGNWFLDREGQWFNVLTDELPLDASARAFAISGLALAPKAPSKVVGPVRLLLPMFAAETIRVQILGRVPPGARTLRWNGVEIPLTDEPTGLRFDVPASIVRPGINEVWLTLPAGSELAKLKFKSLTRWWRKYQ